MVLNSFILGMLTVVAVIVVAVIVRGMVKITQLEKQLKDTQESIEWRDRNNSDMNRDIHERLSRMEEHAYRHMEELKKELMSHCDSRVDKLQSKSKEAQVK
jgi:predicted Holliday junction resolvase-like endonuclease